MTCFTLQRWSALSRIVGIHRDSKEAFRDLERHYCEAHRHYHNPRHIDECLQEFDLARGEAANPVALELAIWFHDVIYDPHANDNEERSAKLTIERLHQVSKDLAGEVHDLILTTKTHTPGTVQDAALLIDIDLSILGKPDERFAEYEVGIRKEYAWVPINVYREKRSEILRGFLNRDRIYTMKYFYDRYEACTRRNISTLISELDRGA
jgi:predicted metal-dependent HD superfamily phosphohydrolase